MATTINTFSVGLTLDAADYINKAALSGQETRRLSRAIEDARTPAEKFSREQDRLNGAMAKGAIDLGVYNRLVDAAKDKQERMAKATENAANRMGHSNKAIGGAIVGLKRLAVGYLGVSTISKSIRLAIEAENAAASFDVLTGSINNSKVLLGDLRSFSDASPLTFGGVQDAAKTMLSFNIPVMEVMKNIKMLGDIAGGNQQRFDSLTLAFSQMSSAGRLMGQDLLQMINAGFNPLQEISRKTGESMMQLRKRMEEGKISSLEISEAFASATGEGGKFNGMTEKLAQTMGGKVAIASANLEKAGVELGNAFGPLIIALTDGFNDGTSAIQFAVSAVGKLADSLGFLVSVGRDAATVIAAIFRGEDYNTITVPIDATNNFLDSLDQRDRDRADAAAIAGKRELDQRAAIEAAAANAAATMADTSDFDKKLQALKMQQVAIEKGDEAAQRLTLAAEGYTAQQIKQLESQEKINKALEDQKKQEEAIAKEKERSEKDRLKVIKELKKAAEDAFTKDVENSLKAAHEYFANQAARDTKMREKLSQGISGDFEVGGSESQKFFADQQNAAIGAAAIPERPTPGEAEIINEAKRIFAEEQKIKAEQHKQQLAATAAIAAAIKDNGFKRLR